MQDYNGDENADNEGGSDAVQPASEYAKQLSDSAEINVRPDLFGNPSVLIKRLNSNGMQRRIYLNRRQWDSLKRLVPKIATAPSVTGISYHVSAKLKVKLSVLGKVDYVGLCVDTAKGTFSLFMTRDEWKKMMGLSKPIDGAMKTIHVRKAYTMMRTRRSSALNLTVDPMAKLYRWAWYEKNRELTVDPTEGYFSEKQCVEVAHKTREGLENVDVAELMMETRDVSTWYNSSELMDALVACLCWHLLTERWKKVTCTGCYMDHLSQKDHMGSGGCLTTVQEAMSNGAFDLVYTGLNMTGVEYVYLHAVEDLKLKWTTVPLPNKRAVTENLKEGVPLFELNGRPYQELFLYHWNAYNQASSDDTDDANDSSSSAGDGV